MAAPRPPWLAMQATDTLGIIHCKKVHPHRHRHRHRISLSITISDTIVNCGPTVGQLLVSYGSTLVQLWANYRLIVRQWCVSVNQVWVKSASSLGQV